MKSFLTCRVLQVYLQEIYHKWLEQQCSVERSLNSKTENLPKWQGWLFCHWYLAFCWGRMPERDWHTVATFLLTGFSGDSVPAKAEGRFWLPCSKIWVCVWQGGVGPCRRRRRRQCDSQTFNAVFCDWLQCLSGVGADVTHSPSLPLCCYDDNWVTSLDLFVLVTVHNQQEYKNACSMYSPDQMCSPSAGLGGGITQCSGDCKMCKGLSMQSHELAFTQSGTTCLHCNSLG